MSQRNLRWPFNRVSYVGMLQAEREARTLSGQKNEYGWRLFEEMESDVFHSRWTSHASGTWTRLPAAGKLNKGFSRLPRRYKRTY